MNKIEKSLLKNYFNFFYNRPRKKFNGKAFKNSAKKAYLIFKSEGRYNE